MIKFRLKSNNIRGISYSTVLYVIQLYSRSFFLYESLTIRVYTDVVRGREILV